MERERKRERRGEIKVREVRAGFRKETVPDPRMKGIHNPLQ